MNASDWYAMWSTGLATITSYEIRNYADFREHVYSLIVTRDTCSTCCRRTSSWVNCLSFRTARRIARF